MSIVDIVLGVLVLYSCWRGFRQGLARQLIQLTGLAVGIGFAEPAAQKAAPYAKQYLTAIPTPIQGPALVLAALIVIWMTISVIGSMYLAAYRRRVYGENSPSFGDSLFGVAIGFVKAAFMVSLMVFGFDQLPESARKLPPVEQEVAKSKGIQLAHDYRLVERLIGTQEVQSIGKRMQELVEYFRQSAPNGAAPDGSSSGTANPPAPAQDAN
jgi:uncharacterized membrane protein required for colicin V production